MTTYSQVQASNSQAQPVPFNGGTNLLPGDKSSKAIVQICDFSVSGVPSTGYTLDATQFIHSRAIAGIQSLYIDNSLNNAAVVVTNSSFNQAISIPAGYQGYFPILAALGSGNKFTIACPDGNQLATVLFLNVLMPLAVWSAVLVPTTSGTIQPVSDAILEACVYAARLNVRNIEAACADVDHSSTIAVGGVAQQVMPANANRRGYRIQNMDGNAGKTNEPLWICTTGNAVIDGVGSMILNPASSTTYGGGSIDGKSTNAISIIAATAGHQYYAIEW